MSTMIFNINEKGYWDLETFGCSSRIFRVYCIGGFGIQTQLNSPTRYIETLIPSEDSKYFYRQVRQLCQDIDLYRNQPRIS
jgi:hypothetical protein